MSNIKPTNTVLLQGWMITELGLSGVELITYALIYGFSQIEGHTFNGSREYIAKWANVSESTIKRTFNKLEEKGLIIRKFNDGRTTSYSVVHEVIDTVMKNLSTRLKMNPLDSSIESEPGSICTDTQVNMNQGGCNMTPNNNIYNNKDNNIINNEKSSEPIEEEATEHNMKLPTITIDPVEEVVNSYNSICKSFPSLQKLTDKRKSSIKRIMASYSIDEIKRAFEMAEESDFLSGRSKAWSGCGFDWIMNQNNIVKILEGNYKNRNARATKPVEDSTEFWMRQVQGEINAPF